MRTRQVSRRQHKPIGACREALKQVAEDMPQTGEAFERPQLEHFVEQERTWSAARGARSVEETQERVERAARIGGGPVHGMPWEWRRRDDCVEKTLRRSSAPLHVDILRRSTSDAVAQPLEERCATGSASSRNDWNA